MRVTTTIRRGLVVSVVAVALAGCSTNDNGSVDPFELTLGDMSRVACDTAGDARSALTDALNAPEESGQRNVADDWGLDPSSEEDIKQAIKELDERIEVCDNEPSDASESPEPSSEETATSPDVVESEDETETDDQSTDEPVYDNPYPDIVGWDQFVAETPYGLQKSIGDNADGLGFGWSDIETWSEARMPDGNLVNARVNVVFGDSNLTNSEVRDITSTLPQVPVVRAARCFVNLKTDREVCPKAGKRVVLILAPVAMDGDTVLGLKPESGVMLKSGLPPITYVER